MVPKKLFMQNLRKVREAKGFTQTDISNKLFIDRTRYANWETGKSEPNINMLAEISKTLNTSLDDLITKEL